MRDNIRVYSGFLQSHRRDTDLEAYLENTDDPVYQLYSNNCDTVVGEIIGTTDVSFLSCQEGMIDTTPNNSYYVRTMLLDQSWKEISIGENNGWEKIISMQGLYYVGYALKKMFEKASGEGCVLE